MMKVKTLSEYELVFNPIDIRGDNKTIIFYGAMSIFVIEKSTILDVFSSVGESYIVCFKICKGLYFKFTIGKNLVSEVKDGK